MRVYILSKFTAVFQTLCITAVSRRPWEVTTFVNVPAAGEWPCRRFLCCWQANALRGLLRCCERRLSASTGVVNFCFCYKQCQFCLSCFHVCSLYKYQIILRNFGFPLQQPHLVSNHWRLNSQKNFQSRQQYQLSYSFVENPRER
jgi:hypothetical protein